MEKIINEQQIKAILELAERYNIGVKDYVGLQTLLNGLPVVKDDKKEEKK